MVAQLRGCRGTVGTEIDFTGLKGFFLGEYNKQEKGASEGLENLSQVKEGAADTGGGQWEGRKLSALEAFLG